MHHVRTARPLGCLLRRDYLRTASALKRNPTDNLEANHQGFYFLELMM